MLNERNQSVEWQWCAWVCTLKHGRLAYAWEEWKTKVKAVQDGNMNGYEIENGGDEIEIEDEEEIKVKIEEQDEEQDAMEDEYEEENNSAIYENDEDEGN